MYSCDESTFYDGCRLVLIFNIFGSSDMIILMTKLYNCIITIHFEEICGNCNILVIQTDMSLEGESIF